MVSPKSSPKFFPFFLFISCEELFASVHPLFPASGRPVPRPPSSFLYAGRHCRLLLLLLPPGRREPPPPPPSTPAPRPDPLPPPALGRRALRLIYPLCRRARPHLALGRHALRLLLPALGRGAPHRRHLFLHLRRRAHLLLLAGGVAIATRPTTRRSRNLLAPAARCRLEIPWTRPPPAVLLALRTPAAGVVALAKILVFLCQDPAIASSYAAWAPCLQPPRGRLPPSRPAVARRGGRETRAGRGRKMGSSETREREL
ncbi:hypothetical protein BRADI_3g50953v3 [Brachypodium distachyon]|uniref:Uncharacterized protein n=1 Tax=Brachypodium distachyon TaxID=15368 RepID=A0A2K2D4I0_BRADI|nr:hypothetical protein BRADI_3g50953v3 [Brachypodium distachyon]